MLLYALFNFSFFCNNHYVYILCCCDVFFHTSSEFLLIEWRSPKWGEGRGKKVDRNWTGLMGFRWYRQITCCIPWQLKLSYNSKMQWAESKWVPKGFEDVACKKKIVFYECKEKENPWGYESPFHLCWWASLDNLSTFDVLRFALPCSSHSEAQVPLKTFRIICMCPIWWYLRSCSCPGLAPCLNSMNKYARSAQMPHAPLLPSHLQLAQRWYYLIFCRFDFRFMLFLHHFTSFISSEFELKVLITEMSFDVGIKQTDWLSVYHKQASVSISPERKKKLLECIVHMSAI